LEVITVKNTDGVFPYALERLIEQFAMLPGIGTKSAQRMAFYILALSDERASGFAESILDAKRNIRRCSECQNLSDSPVCPICSSDRRDRSVIFVVESPKDLLAMERTREYSGLYHVLHGVISPIKGVTPDDLTIQALLRRAEDESVREVILALSPGAESEATMIYLSKLLRTASVKVTRIAYGLPMGGSLEFADEATLYRALDGRVEVG
jgi:recombination protein RecR